MESSSAGFSRSGRLRKKSAKLIEMEEIDKGGNVVNNNNNSNNEHNKLNSTNCSLLSPSLSSSPVKPKLKIKISGNTVYTEHNNSYNDDKVINDNEQQSNDDLKYNSSYSTSNDTNYEISNSINDTVKCTLNNSEIVPPFKIRIISPIPPNSPSKELVTPKIKITSPTNKKLIKKLTLNCSNGNTVKETTNKINNNLNNTQPIIKPIKINRKIIECETPANKLFNQITSGVTSTPIDNRKRKKPLKLSLSSTLIKNESKLYNDNDDNYQDDEDAEASLVIADLDESLADAVEQARRVKNPKMMKTSSEKRQEKQAKHKNKLDTVNNNINSKEKTKRRTPLVTAYTLFARFNRQKIQEGCPGLDFASVSKRLGEVWQALPPKEKMQWKKRAIKEKEENELQANEREREEENRNKLKLATSSPSLIVAPPSKSTANKNTSSSVSTIKNSSSLINKITKLSGPASSTPPSSLSSLNSSIKSKISPSQSVIQSNNQHVNNILTQTTDLTKLGISPIDISAQLALLGNSLTLIGERLKENQQLAVSGSLSLLLDSTLCALGPLMCLTTLTEETNGCSNDIHEKTLDNLSFLMPGI